MESWSLNTVRVSWQERQALAGPQSTGETISQDHSTRRCDCCLLFAPTDVKRQPARTHRDARFAFASLWLRFSGIRILTVLERSNFFSFVSLHVNLAPAAWRVQHDRRTIYL